MTRQNWHWDLNLSESKLKKILARENDPRFVRIAGTLLSRTEDPEQVFKLISQASFCRRWNAIEREIKSDEWNKEKAAFWKATYLRLSKELQEKGERIRKPELIELDTFDRALIEKVKQCRRAVAMSQKEIAQFMGYSQQFISGIETGREKITVDFLKKFEHVTGHRILPIIGINKIEKFAGFAMSNAKSGEQVMVQTKGVLTSDDELFHTFMDGICSFLSQYATLFLNSIYQFLLVIHMDESADLYINELPLVSIEINAKRTPIEKGQIIRYCDIVDIRRLRFDGIDLKESDNIIYCFKVGWKFGLYFDLERINPQSHPLNLDALSHELGVLYRYLAFQYVYKILESKNQFEQLLEDGWFPFIELLGDEFKTISDVYQNPFDLENRIATIVNKFGATRLDLITKKWWNNPIFKEKQPILEAGIKAYLQDSPEGFIQCIKTLLPEIEGILRSQHFLDRGFDSGKSESLIKHVAEKAESKAQSKSSLFCPVQFIEYMQKVIFPTFDLASGKLELSRHTSSHGLAKAEEYTKTRSLQTILILDQIYFYLL